MPCPVFCDYSQLPWRKSFSTLVQLTFWSGWLWAAGLGAVGCSDTSWPLSTRWQQRSPPTVRQPGAQALPSSSRTWRVVAKSLSWEPLLYSTKCITYASISFSIIVLKTSLAHGRRLLLSQFLLPFGKCFPKHLTLFPDICICMFSIRW